MGAVGRCVYGRAMGMRVADSERTHLLAGWALSLEAWWVATPGH